MAGKFCSAATAALSASTSATNLITLTTVANNRIRIHRVSFLFLAVPASTT